MGVIKSVTSGEPIKASWANSIVHEVNTKQGLRMRGKASNSTSLRPVRVDNDPAWQIRYTCGKACINAGQVYINGMLIDGGVASFNQVCSAKNWAETSVYIPKSADDLPFWFLTISCPKKVTKENLKDVECLLVRGAKEDDVPKPPESQDGEEEKELIIIQINSVKDGTMVQRVSGSIYIEQSPISMIAGDGIKIEQTKEGETDVYEVSLNVSFIGEDGINVIEDTEETEDGAVKVVKITATSDKTSIIGEDGINVDYSDGAYTISTKLNVKPTDEVITVNQYTDADNTIVVELGANIPDVEHKQVSIIAGDGIIVDSKEYDDVITYTVSTTFSPIKFDEEWFIIEEDGTVTLNEEKLEQEALAIAPTVSSQITTTTTATIDTVNDCGREGDIMLEVVTEGDSATARAWTQW